MNLASLLLRAAESAPTRPALYSGTTLVHDYAGLAAKMRAVAGGLLARGLQRGDRVAIAMTNCPEYLEVLYGAWAAGLIVVPVNAKLHPSEMTYIFEHSGAAIVLATPAIAAKLQAAAAGAAIVALGSKAYDELSQAAAVPIADSAASDVAWIFYTSGTTGRPKGAVLSHGALLAMALKLCAAEPIGIEDSFVYAAPISHGAGLQGIAWIAQRAAHVVPASGAFDADEIAELLGHHTNVSFFAAPTMVRRLVDSEAMRAAPMQNLRAIIYGGAPMYGADLARALEAFGPRMYQAYGLGEAPVTLTYLDRRAHVDDGDPHYASRIASVGITYLGTEIRIVDVDGRPIASDEVGEVTVRSDHLMQGYWQDQNATADAIRDGWLWTGDMGLLDARGHLHLSDRSKDVVISGGTNIYPREVEEVLLDHPDVVEVAVIGRQDPEWGEVPVAYVALRANAKQDPGALDAVCLARIARFKRPKAYVFVETMPKSAYGKILKSELRQIDLDKAAGAAA